MQKLTFYKKESDFQTILSLDFDLCQTKFINCYNKTKT